MPHAATKVSYVAPGARRRTLPGVHLVLAGSTGASFAMRKYLPSAMAAISLLGAFLLSPAVTHFVNECGRRFPAGLQWLVKLVLWTVISAVLFGVCLLVAFVHNQIARSHEEKEQKAKRAGLRKTHNSVQSYVEKFAGMIRRFATELAQETSENALQQHLEMDAMCFRALEIIRNTPESSLRHLTDGYDIEHEIFEAILEHYEIEVRRHLTQRVNVRQRISSAAFGANCVALLATRMVGLFAEKRMALDGAD
jgi:hypothetical protein